MSSLSNIQDSVYFIRPWIQLVYPLIFHIGSVPCDSVNNRPRFLLITGLRRDFLRHRNARGTPSLFIPLGVNKRRISDIEGNTRYDLIWVGVLGDAVSIKSFMKKSSPIFTVLGLTCRSQNHSPSQIPPNKEREKKVPNDKGRVGKPKCDLCRKRKRKVTLAKYMEG